MKIAFPVQEDKGTNSTVYGHYGSAGFFILIDTDSLAVEALVNRDKDHAHGHCQPLKALGGKEVDAVVVGGIGGGALSKLNAMGVKVYRAVEGTVQENATLILAGRLPEFTMDQTCGGHHGFQGGCSH